MQLTQKGKISALIYLASAIFSLMTVTYGFFPHFGFSISLVIFTTLAYHIKKDKNGYTKIFFAITLVLSILLSFRSQELVILLDVLGIVCFGSLMVVYDSRNKLTLFSVVSAPILIMLKSPLIKSEYFLESTTSIDKKKSKENTVNSVTIGLFTLIILAIILPLLASANPFFKEFVTKLIDLVGLRNIKITESIFRWVMRVVVFFILAIFVPKIATLENKDNGLKLPFQESLNMLVPKIAIAAVLAIFFVMQIQLYFASSATLEQLGYTYSRQANEVFTQLSVVAFIALIILYGEKVSGKFNKIFTVVLAIQGIFLTFMAYNSVYNYSISWGFTYKRLYGFTVATWVLGLFLIYLYSFIKKTGKEMFLKSSIVFSGIILILINLANFDYLIYHYRKAATGQGVDYKYLSRLSSDSLSYDDQLLELAKNLTQEVTEVEKNEATDKGLWLLIYKIERLQKKYKHMDIRGFNLLEYLSYQKIKDVDTEFLRNKYQLVNPPGGYR